MTVRVETKANGKFTDVKVTLDDGTIENLEACDFGPRQGDAGFVYDWAVEQAEARKEYQARPDVIAAKEAERLAREAEEAAAEDAEEDSEELEPQIATFEGLRARLVELDAFNFPARVARLETLRAEVEAAIAGAEALKDGGN